MIKPVQARVWPHGHNKEFSGPHDVKIGVTSQPAVLVGWNKTNKPLISLEQPRVEESNFTILRILFLKPGVRHPDLPPCAWHKANVWGLRELPYPSGTCQDPELDQAAAKVWVKNKPSHLTVYLRTRLTSALKHPIPLGKWEGTVTTNEEGHWAVFALQAVTLAVQPVEKKRSALILPGDPGFDTPPDYKKLVR